MPKICCVPGCRAGYRTEQHKPGTLHFFYPRLDSISAWNKAIPRDFILKTTHSVCSRHFSEQSIIKQDEFLINGEKVVMPRLKWSLRVGAIPEIFPNPPAYLTKAKKSRKAPASTNNEHRKKWRIDKQEEKGNTESSNSGFCQDFDDSKTKKFRKSPTSIHILDDIENIRITEKEEDQINLGQRRTDEQEEKGNTGSSDTEFLQGSDECKTKKSRKTPTSRSKGLSNLKKRRTGKQKEKGNTESSDTEFPQDSDDLKTKKAFTFRNKEDQLNLTVSPPDSDKLKTENTFLKQEVRRLQRLIRSYEKRLSKYEKPNKDLENRNKKSKMSSKAVKNVQSGVIKKKTRCLRSTRRYKEA